MGQKQNEENQEEDIRTIFPEIKNVSINSYQRIFEKLQKRDRIDQAGIIDLVRKEKNINLEERLFIATKLAIHLGRASVKIEQNNEQSREQKKSKD